MAEPIEGAKPTPDEILKQELEKKEAELKAKFEKDMQDREALIREELNNKYKKELEDLVLETKKTEPQVVINDKETPKEPEVSDFAKKILEKREQEILADKKAKEDAEKLKLEAEVNTYRLEKKLKQMFKDEPYMEEPVLAAMQEGVIKSENDIKIYFNKVAKERFKLAWVAENNAKKAGLDPLALYEDGNVITDELAKKQRKEALVEQWKKKLR